MAIYSCNVRSIGKTTHASGTAGAHLSYIGRTIAEPVLLAEHMPVDPTAARTWMDQQERGDRANARLGDKVRLALPRELSPDARADLVKAFVGQLGGGRIPWFAGIHQTGDDRHNPHAHVFIRDRDFETGRRVLRLSDSTRDREKAGLEPKAVDWLRERWETTCNAALEKEGSAARIDRRSLEAQGVDRDPTIHVGPRAQHIQNNVDRPVSRVRTDGRGRRIDYPMIDAGRTRVERNAEIIDINLERAARSPDFETRERAKWERDQRRLDQALEGELVIAARRRTLERRRVRGESRRELDVIRTRETGERRLIMKMVRAAKAPALASMRERHKEERAALADKESGLFKRIMLVVDFTGTSKRKRDASRAALQGLHRRERTAAATDYRASRKTHQEAVTATYAPLRKEVLTVRDDKLAAMRDRHQGAESEADQRRQAREADRERESSRFDMTFRVIKGAGSDRNRDQQMRHRDRDGPSR